MKKGKFTIDEISDLMYRVDEELIYFMSSIEDYACDEGVVPDAVNIVTATRLLEIIDKLEELNDRYFEINKKKAEMKGGSSEWIL